MEDDAIVKDVRRARERIVREAGGDLDALVTWLRRSEADHGRQVVEGSGPGREDLEKERRVTTELQPSPGRSRPCRRSSRATNGALRSR
jgi:hypothetical protein